LFHQTRKTYNTIDFVRKVIEWRGSLTTFFEYVTGHKTRAFQEDFFKEIESFEKRNIGIVAGRGIGKTHALAVVALWYLLVFAIAENKPIKVIILGGSLKQAKICYGYIMEAINKIPYLENQLAKEPTQDEIHFKDGSWVMPLPASEKSVRGNHPDILIVDEAAQVENSIIYAALPMTATSKYARHIFSTTPGSGYSFIEEQWEKRKRLGQDWVFLNWDAELCLPPDHLRMLKEMMSEDAYQTEIKGIPYRLEGKVFRIEDMKLCQKSDITYQRIEGLNVYAGIDWGYCLTGDHEVLTKSGWKRLDTFCSPFSEEVMTYNKKTNFLEWEIPTKFYKKKTLRLIDQWENANLSIAGAWRHNIPVFDREKKFLHDHMLGEDLSHHYLIRKGKFKGKRPRFLHGFNADDFASLLGWYLAEGSVDFTNRGHRITIGQTEVHPEYRKEIKELLGRMRLNPHEHKIGIRFSDRKLSNFFATLGNSYMKYIPSSYKELHPDLLEKIKVSMMKGDGDKDGLRYNTYSKKLVDDLQEITLKIGKQTTYVEDRGKKGYRLHLLNRESSPNKKNHSQLDFDGYHVGIEVPNEYILFRRKGKPCILHNFPAPTVLIIVQQRKDEWEILYMRDFLKEDPGKVQDDIKETCLTYGVNMIFTDSTDKGENARLMTTGLPVQPITFKGEKSIMITNLRMLIEKHKLFWDSMKHQPLIQQLLDYTYNSKRNDDYVDALMLAVHENDMGKGSFATDIEEYFKVGITKDNNDPNQTDKRRRHSLHSSGRI